MLACLVLAAAGSLAAQTDLDERLEHPIHSLLMEKESPLLGIRWSGELFGDLPVGDEPAGAEPTLRRAKLKFQRSLGTAWQIRLAADYNPGGKLELSDNYVVYTGWKTALVKLGVADPPFSLESVSAAAGRTFMEPALPVAALSERKGGGVKLLKRTPKSILNASLLLFSPQQDGLSDSGQALVLHYVHSPVAIGRQDNLHLGGSLSYRVNADEEDTRFRSRPEVATANTFFVDTGEIEGASEVLRGGLEANRVQGRFSWQTELLASRVERRTGDAVRFWGAYLFASWFLTADSRNYDFGQGEFVPVKVASPVGSGGWGALELAVRASTVDLQDGDIEGGSQSNFSLGLNWYLDDHIRIMGNVVKVLDVDRPGSEYDGLDPLIFALRAQWLIQ